MDSYITEVDDKGRTTYYSTASKNHWWKRQYDQYDNCIYYEDSTGFWVKKEFNENGTEVYFENSYGVKQANKE